MTDPICCWLVVSQDDTDEGGCDECCTACQGDAYGIITGVDVQFRERDLGRHVGMVDKAKSCLLSLAQVREWLNIEPTLSGNSMRGLPFRLS